MKSPPEKSPVISKREPPTETVAAVALVATFKAVAAVALVATFKAVRPINAPWMSSASSEPKPVIASPFRSAGVSRKALAPDLKLNASLPAPPETVFLPVPPSMVSLPSPPYRVSSPAAPLRLSWPPTASKASFPAVPTMVLLAPSPSVKTLSLNPRNATLVTLSVPSLLPLSVTVRMAPADARV